MSCLILIAGLPATGKTAFAEYLGKKMRLPVVSKDRIKEHLFDTLGFKSREEKVSLGSAAWELVCYFAEIHLEAGSDLILENNFETISRPNIMRLVEKYAPLTLTVKFTCDPGVLSRRFLERDNSPGRHRGHVVNSRYPEIPGEPGPEPRPRDIYPQTYFNAMEQRGMGSFSIGGREIQVDTTDFSRVSYEKVFEEIIAALN